MPLSRKAKGWIWFTIGTILALPVLLIATIGVVCYMTGRPQTLYTINEREYEFAVIDEPGGGAIGPVGDLVVTVSGGKWNDYELVRAEGADSAAVKWIDSTRVWIVILNGSYDLWPDRTLVWRRTDSAKFDLQAMPGRHVRFDGPG